MRQEAAMNTIQQISLKLQMGIDPSTEIQPELLRAMWGELATERWNALSQSIDQANFRPAKPSHPNFRLRG
jgi:hypothetical protein